MIPEQASERNQLDVADQVQAPSVGFLKLRLDNLHRHEIARRVAVAARRGARLMVMNANAHLATLAQRQSWLPELFSQADIAFCDGAGVQFAAFFLTGKWLQRTTPPEWIGPVLERLGPEASIFWIGGQPEIAAQAAAAYEARYHVKTAGVQHGYFDADPNSADSRALIARINAARPNIILLNMGMPRQERWLLDNYHLLETGVAITAGALVDHAAGRVRRPPRWVANLGVEWLVRLLVEPRRLWRRYLLGLPVFGYYVLCHALSRGRA